MKSIFVAIPSYDGRISLNTMRGLFEGIEEARKRGYLCKVFDMSGNCYVHQARSILAAEFLDSMYDDLFFIDTDMSFSGKDFLSMLPYEEGIVAADYPSRKGDKRSTTVFLDDKTTSAFPCGPLLEVMYAATGFMKIHRGVIEALYENFPQYSSTRTTLSGRHVNMIFDTGFETENHIMNDWYGEDYRFCKRWRSIGGKVFIDPTIRPGHIGETIYTFE